MRRGVKGTGYDNTRVLFNRESLPIHDTAASFFGFIRSTLDDSQYKMKLQET